MFYHKKLGRRSSAPVAARRSSLEPMARRVSEPSVLFRSRSPHADSTAKLSDYMRQEFCQFKKGKMLLNVCFVKSSLHFRH